MRVRDLENWPPEPCGVFKTTFVLPIAEQAIIQKVLHMFDIWITFSCELKVETTPTIFKLSIKECHLGSKSFWKITSAKASLPSATLSYQNPCRRGRTRGERMNRARMNSSGCINLTRLNFGYAVQSDLFR